MQRFGEKLSKLRASHSLTIRQLGKMLDVDHTYVSQLENGKARPSVEMILAVSDIFQVSTDALMKDDLDVL
jgi:transcriptional regulator with XRE-family HTH domain